MAKLIQLQLNGSDTSTTITNDGSLGTTFSVGGGAELDTGQSKFGGSSAIFDGASGTLIDSDSSDIALPTGGTGWTIEYWIRYSSITNENQFYFRKSDTDRGVRIYLNTTLLYNISEDGSAWNIASNVAGTKNNFVVDTWYHIALVRDVVDGKYYGYVDGVLDVTINDSTAVTFSDGRLRLGANQFGSGAINGWLDEFVIDDTALYPGGTTFILLGPTDGTAALSLPTKTVTAVGAAPGSRITLPTKVAYGPFNGGFITLPSKTVAGTGLKAATAYIVLPSKTAVGVGGSGDNLDATLPEFTSAFAAYVGGSFAISLNDPWLDLATTALLGSTATVAATPDRVLAGFTAIQGPFGLDATLPLAQASMTASVGSVATLKAQAPRLVSRLTGEGTYSATFAVQAILPVAALTALRGATASITMKLPVPKAALSAQQTTEGTVAATIAIFTSAFSGYTQASATFAMAMPKWDALLDADSQYTFDRTLVMNATTYAASEYANYAFNSFCEFNGAYYAADANGVYALDTGDVDDGSAEIPANITTGDLDFANEFQKRVPDIYAALRAAGDMTVSVSMDEQATYEYTLTTHGVTRLKQRRVKIGKGVKGKYCRVGVANVSGADFDLDTLNITATQSKNRRI